jgi:flagellar biosynthesis/type III secretory pathway chaperone
MDYNVLTEAISEQTSLLTELLQVLESETADMGNLDMVAMNVSNQTKEALIAKISSHSQMLQLLITQTARREALPESATLEVIATHVAKTGNRKLVELQKRLRSSAEQVQQIAALNKGIAERFVTTAADSLTLISRMLNQSSVYGASGGYQTRHAGAVIINREA